MEEVATGSYARGFQTFWVSVPLAARCGVAAATVCNLPLLPHPGSQCLCGMVFDGTLSPSSCEYSLGPSQVSLGVHIRLVDNLRAMPFYPPLQRAPLHYRACSCAASVLSSLQGGSGIYSKGEDKQLVTGRQGKTRQKFTRSSPCQQMAVNSCPSWCLRHSKPEIIVNFCVSLKSRAKHCCNFTGFNPKERS